MTTKERAWEVGGGVTVSDGATQRGIEWQRQKAGRRPVACFCSWE